MASLRAGTTSHSDSYPRRMFARRFCSLWMWFARFCDGDNSVPFPFAPPLTLPLAALLVLVLVLFPPGAGVPLL